MTKPKELTGSSSDASPRAVMTIKDVARELDCCTRTVKRLIDSGEIPAPVRLRKSLTRWPRQVIETWIANGFPSCRRGGKK